MILLAVIAGITIVVVIYALWLRPWMVWQQSGWARRFLDWIEPIELRWWRKSETILFNKWLKFVGLLLPLLQIGEQIIYVLAGFDVTPLLPILPPEWVAWVSFGAYIIGLIGQKLRERTTKPAEIVAVPSTAPIEVQVAVAQAASANDNALAVINDAKASGTLKAA